MCERATVAVIGAGMAGLAAAYRLKQGGLVPTVFEAEAQVGGRAATTVKQGYVMDTGAIMLAPTYRRTLALARDAGVADGFASRRPVLAIVRDGIVHEIDLGRPFASLRESPVLSARAKLALLRVVPDVLRHRRRCHFHSMGALAGLDRESSESYAVRTLGQEVHDYLVDPLIRVNMFTSTSDTPAADLIWLLNAFSGGTVTYAAGGMNALPRTIASTLDVRLRQRAVSVAHEGDGARVVFDDGTAARFDAVVVATPPPNALAMAPWLDGPRRTFFDSAAPVRSVTVSVGLAHRPGGAAALILVPTLEHPDVLAVVMDHNKSADRAPEGKGLVTLHMRQEWVERHRGADDDTLAREAVGTARSLLGASDAEVEMTNVHHWPYVDYARHVGCYGRLAAMMALPPESPVLFAGEYISAGIEGAVISGETAAARIVGRSGPVRSRSP